MATRLSTYLDNFALLSPAKFGFQRGKSTYMALLEMQTCMSEAMTFNKYSLGVFFDISKAFDTVNHTLLINKLEHYGIRGIAKQWFIDYLNNRKQYVSLKEVMLRSAPARQVSPALSQMLRGSRVAAGRRMTRMGIGLAQGKNSNSQL